MYKIQIPVVKTSDQVDIEVSMVRIDGDKVVPIGTFNYRVKLEDFKVENK